MSKVAAVNSWSEPLALDKNLAGIASIIQDLDSQHVQYALFPELCVSGYINNADDLDTYVASHDDVMKQLITLSKKHPITFSVGLPMPLKQGFGIAQLTFLAGEVIHTHFKTHLSVHEQQTYESGRSLTLFRHSDFNTGMQLCLESHYPELSLIQQQQGAWLLCFAYASPRETPAAKAERLKMIWQARAYDNACFVMACNQTGQTPSGNRFAGVACIVSPRGKVLAEYQSMEPGYCIAELDKKAIARIKNSMMSDFLAYRNTELHFRFK